MIISNLRKKLGDFELFLERLEISGPGIYGLIGPNGCGKTTCAKLVSGVLEADSGHIDYGGLSQRDVTWLPQKSYFMNASVYENLVYPLKVRGIKPDNAICEFYLEKIGLSRRSKQKALTLSSGEQQKLALARAMIFEPKLVVADEALTDLDIDSVALFEDMILKTRDKIIWVVISHQLPHVQRLCEYIFFMHQGRLATEGPADDILVRPVNPLVRQYLRQEVIKTEVLNEAAAS